MADPDDVGSAKADADEKSRSYLYRRYKDSIDAVPKSVKDEYVKKYGAKSQREHTPGDFSGYGQRDIKQDPVPGPLIRVFNKGGFVKKGSATVPQRSRYDKAR